MFQCKINLDFEEFPGRKNKGKTGIKVYNTIIRGLVKSGYKQIKTNEGEDCYITIEAKK